MKTTVLDYYGLPIKVGDVVTFPAGGEMNDGVVEKIIVNTRNKKLSTLKVRNSSNYLKSKYCKDMINKTIVQKTTAQYKI